MTTGVLAGKPSIRAVSQTAFSRAHAIPLSHFTAVKSHAGQTTVTRMIQDSIAFFDNTAKSYVPGGIISASYSNDGRPESETQRVLNTSLASLRGIDNSKTLYVTDQQGHVQTITEQIQYNGEWVNQNKFEFAPYLGITMDRNVYASGKGFDITCPGLCLYSFLQSSSNCLWDTNSKAWINSSIDTVITESNNKKILILKGWDTASASYQIIGYDTLYISGGLVAKSIMSIDYFGLNMNVYTSATYDASGNETEELQQTEMFLETSSTKVIQTFDSRNNLLSSILQDSSNGPVALDSCPKKLCKYAYDNAGLVVSRVDSSWYSNDSILVDKHFFTYRTFSSAILPRPSNAAAKRLFISHRGMVGTSAPVSIHLFSLSGKRVGEATLSASGSIWNALRGGSVALSKGMYLAKIQGTPESFAVWHE